MFLINLLLLYSVFNEHFSKLNFFIKFCKHLSNLKCLRSLKNLVGPSGLEPPTSCLSGTRSNHLSYEPICTWFLKDRLVEMMGFEPMTPCLQGRCSPSWATPPNLHLGFAVFSVFVRISFTLHRYHSVLAVQTTLKRSFKIEQRTQKISLSRLTTNIVFVSVDSP